MVFRPHPQVIQRFFNINWFGPPPRVTGGSACSRIDHPASGPPRATRRALRTRFRFGSATGLTSRRGTTRRLIMQKACGHPQGAPTVWGRMISGSFHSLQKGSFHLSPHGTGALSVGGQYLALWNGLHGFGRGFTCPALLGMRPRNLETPRTGLSPSAAGLSRPLRSNLIPIVPSRNPAGQARRFGLLRVRSPLLAESLLISSPRGTEMFHFPRSRLPPLWIQGGMVRHDPHRIAPFGNPWIKVRLQLPMDYRGLPRPSSPAVA